jgi:hypothetical protein
MTTFSTNIKTNDISSITGELVASSQTSFTLAPHCSVAPSTAEDLTNKEYVDTRLVNSGSGTNLYFNYSVVDTITPFRQLGTSIVIAIQSTITKFQDGNNTIASFITDVGYPGTTSIPSGIWELNQFGYTGGGSVGILQYYFILYIIPLVGSSQVIGQSNYSADVNTSVTDIFFAQLSAPAITLLATDRLAIDICSNGTDTILGTTFVSQFQGDTYSYITTPLVSGSNFLSLNNVFTGVNSFTNDLSASTQITCPKIVTSLVDTPTLSDTLQLGNILTTGTIEIGKNMSAGRVITINPLGKTNIAAVTISSNEIEASAVDNNIYLGNNSTTGNIGIGVSQTSGSLFIGNGGLRTGPIRIGALAPSSGSSGPITIGHSACPVAIYGNSTSSIAFPKLDYAGTLTVGTVSSTGLTLGRTGAVTNINGLSIAISGSLSNPIAITSAVPTFPQHIGSSSSTALANASSSISVTTTRLTSGAGLSLIQGSYLCSINAGYIFVDGIAVTSANLSFEAGMTQQADNSAVALIPLSQTSGITRIQLGAQNAVIGTTSRCCVLTANVVLQVPSSGTYYGSASLTNNAIVATNNPRVWAQLVSIVRIG